MAIADFYEGKGPVLLGVIWTWAGVASLLYLLRISNAAHVPHGSGGLIGLRWDFIWVSIAYVGNEQQLIKRL